MKSTDYPLTKILFAAAMLLGVTIFSMSMAHSKDNVTYPKNDKEVVQAAFNTAGIVFPIDDEVTQNGRIVDMVITRNARSLQKESTAYEISAMKKVSVEAPSTCPLVNSTAIDKDVQNYNPLTGRANIQVTFITEAMAAEVSKADCLLIYDTETEPYSE